jgi:drug/metabolite transporter (DMT)-like permease
VAAPLTGRHWFDWLLAWYFVSVWGSGFLATKVGLQHAAPFTFLTLRFAVGIGCLIPIVILMRPRFPSSPAEFGHVIAAGLLMHAVHLGGSHYTQYLGMSAGITALLLSAQPLVTALIAARWMNETLGARQWAGILIGLAGVTLVVWHKIDVREATIGSLIAVTIALAGVTAGSISAPSARWWTCVRPHWSSSWRRSSCLFPSRSRSKTRRYAGPGRSPAPSLFS